MPNETTTKFKVDISELKKEFQEASRQVRLANSEFKAATAGMDSWGTSADGISAKTKQLNTVLDAQKQQLSSLKQQYALVSAEQGENSRGAQELLVKINNQQAAVSKTEAELKKYNQQLQELTTESGQGESATDKLTQEISNQEEELAQLKKKYSDLVLEQGKSSEEAKDCANQIKNLSGELDDNKQKLSDASGAADELAGEIQDAGDKAGNTEGGFSVMKGALADLLADGIRAVIDGLKDLVLTSDSAYASFQAQTGTSKEAMSQFREEMDDLYSRGFGDSLDDIADSMAKVAQNTKETDPTKIKELTENALTLRDTFGFEVTESMRAVNMLMDQFGISGEEAFNLIVQGAQNGLDKNGDLLDSINEYSVHYKQMGYSADDFFNSLANGTDAGTFSVDKLGDAMKEFGIRSKDTASSTKEGFALLGYSAEASAEDIEAAKDEIADLEKNLQYATMEQDNFNDSTSELTRMKNADKIQEYSEKLEAAKQNLENMTTATGESGKSVEELQKQFAAGGDEARKATQEVLDKLFEMEDEVERNQAGVDLFGTMWEDLGEDGVKALMDTQGELEATKKSMEDVKKVKYEDVKSQFKQLGRTIQTDFLMPLAQKALPKIKEFVTYCINNIDKIIPVIDAVGTAIVVAFAVKKISDFSTAISGLFSLIAAHPVGALITAIGLATGAMIAYEDAQKKAIEAEWGLTEEQQKSIDKTNELYTAYNDLKTSRDNAFSDTSSEFGYYEDLWDELQGIVDQNGVIKSGYEDRANFITTTLSNALGIEISVVDGVIQEYGKLDDQIKTVMQTKHAEAILAADDEMYTEAIRNKTTAMQEYQTAIENEKATRDKLTEAQNAYNDAWEQYEALVESGISVGQAYNIAIGDTGTALDAAKEAHNEASTALEQSEDKYLGYISTIENHEGLVAATLSGDAASVELEMSKVTTSFQSAESGTKESLERQVKNMKQNYDDLKKAVENGTPGVTQEMVDQAATMVDMSVSELKKYGGQAYDQGVYAMKMLGISQGKYSNVPVMKAEEIAELTGNALEVTEAGAKGEKADIDYTEGLKRKKSNATDFASVLANGVVDELASADYSGAGSEGGGEYASGINSQSTAAKNSGNVLSWESLTGMQSGDFRDAGSKSGGRYASGISDKSYSAKSSGIEIGNSAKSGAESVDAAPSGNNFTTGFANGITEAIQSVADAARNIASKALSTVQQRIREGSPSKETYKSGVFFGQGFANGIAEQIKNVVKVATRMADEAIQAANSELSQPLTSTIRLGSMNMQHSLSSEAKRSSNYGIAPNSSVVNNNYYYTQNNSSPKPLSRLEIYRQTKNQLNLKFT